MIEELVRVVTSYEFWCGVAVCLGPFIAWRERSARR
jgi:hypothetical protein